MDFFEVLRDSSLICVVALHTGKGVHCGRHTYGTAGRLQGFLDCFGGIDSTFESDDSEDLALVRARLFK